MNREIISESRIKKSVKKTQQKNKADEPLIIFKETIKAKKINEKITEELKPCIHSAILLKRYLNIGHWNKIQYRTQDKKF